MTNSGSHDPSLTLESIFEHPDLAATREKELPLAVQLKERIPEARPDQLVRFLRAREHNLDDAEKMLRAHLAWREKTFPIDLDNSPHVKEELEKAKVCFYGRDAKGQLVAIVRLRLMGRHTYQDIETVKLALAHVAEHIEARLAPTEKVVVMFSRLKATKANSDLDWVKTIGEMFQHNYPERLSVAYVAPVGIFFYGVWKVAQFFFDAKTRDKIQISRSESIFTDVFEAEYVPEELGGKCKRPISAQDLLLPPSRPAAQQDDAATTDAPVANSAEVGDSGDVKTGTSEPPVTGASEAGEPTVEVEAGANEG